MRRYRIGKTSAARLTGFLLVAIFAISAAGAQIVPVRPNRSEFAVFGELSINALRWNADPSHYSALYGGAAGAYLQTRPWLGAEGRALWLESANQKDHEEHQRALFLGPRFVFVHRRLSLDGIVLGGLSHSDYPSLPLSAYSNGQVVLASSTGAALEAGGGLNLRLSSRISWKAGEVIYGHAFSANGPQGAAVSSGIAIRLFR